MAAAISEAYPDLAVELVAGTKGVFTVKADELELWNKHKSGSFPESAALVAKLGSIAAP